MKRGTRLAPIHSVRKESLQEESAPGKLSTDTEDELTSRLYRVRPGDDLHSIAAAFYGRRDLWVFIYVANPDEIHGIRDLRPGRVLNIPELPIELGPSRPAASISRREN